MRYPVVLSLALVWSPIALVLVGMVSSESTCDCNPVCTTVQVSMDCTHGRLASREDCPCCKVCLRQVGERCGDENSPCDTKMGLTCSPKGICEGNAKCKLDSDCPTDRFCVKDMCANPCPLLQPCLGSLKNGQCVTREHQPRCECPKGLIPDRETNSCIELEENPSTHTTVPPTSYIGCKTEEHLLSIGESFYTRDCSKKCVCGEAGEISCDPLTCPSGLFPVGASNSQRFCIEIRSATLPDECCVVLACSSNFLQSIHSPSSKLDFKSPLEKTPRSLTARKAPSDDGQAMFEHEYQQRLEELEALLNGNVSFGNEHDQLSKDKKTLSKSFSIADKPEATSGNLTATTDKPVELSFKEDTTRDKKLLLLKNSMQVIKDEGRETFKKGTSKVDVERGVREDSNLEHEKKRKAEKLRSEGEIRDMKMKDNAKEDTINAELTSETEVIGTTENPYAYVEITTEEITDSENTENTKVEEADIDSRIKMEDKAVNKTETKHKMMIMSRNISKDHEETKESVKADVENNTSAANLTDLKSDKNINDETRFVNLEHGNRLSKNETMDDMELGEVIPTTEDMSSFLTYLLQNVDASESFLESNSPMSAHSTAPFEMTTHISTEIPIFAYSPQNNTEESPLPFNDSNLTLTTTMPNTSSSSSTAAAPTKITESTSMNDAVLEDEDLHVTTLTPGDESVHHKEGMIMEVAEDGKPLHNVSLLSEMAFNESFREGKKTDEGGFKPIHFPDKDLKTTMIQHDKTSSTKPGMIQIKSSTHNSTTLLLPSSSGGALHYKESRSDIEAMKMAVESGQEEVTVTGLIPNTRYTFKWAGSGTESSKGKIEAKTEDGCLHNTVSYAIGAQWHDGCQNTCTCHKGGASECRPRCIFVAGAIQDQQCEEVPSTTDPECCVEYNCEKKDNSVLDVSKSTAPDGGNQEAEPKLIVTARAHNSVTVAWDDFRADNPDRGYVTEYREVPEVELGTEIPWMKKETLRGQPPPTMTIGSLKPNTLYEVRVGIYSQAEERRLSAATETITVRTEPGCVYGNTSFPVGEFFQGCEERCSCLKDGSVKCAGRCTIPYFRKGSFANDPLCTEELEEGDECCVLVMCAHGSGGDAADYDQCANTVCGKNAECVPWPTLTEASDNTDPFHPGSCRCKQGFSGDPSDHVVGCSPDLTSADEKDVCVFKLGTNSPEKTYNPGDVFFDGCSYKCTCSSQKEIECQPRCTYSVDAAEEEMNDSCTFQPDPDDDCCKIRVCNSTSDVDAAAAAVQSPALDFDGCTYRNKTYSKNEEFSFGCDSKCLCMGFGDVSCFPRCPPVKEISKKEGVQCETLLDPDDECCNVTVCDDAAPDVMKANVKETTLAINSTEAITTMEDDDNETTTIIPIGVEMNEEPMNESVTDVELLMHKKNKTTEEVSADEVSVSNVTLVAEDMKEDGVNSSNTEKSMEGNSTEIMTRNDTDTFSLENDMMTKHENETEADATVIETDMKHNMTDEVLNNERTKNETEDIFMMKDHKEEVLGRSLDNDTETTSDAGKIFEEDILVGDEENKNESDALMKTPRLDDIMLPPLEISNIHPLDSSSVRLTLKVTHDVLARLLSSGSEFMVVSYSPDSLEWTNRTFPVNDIEVQNMYELVFFVPGLHGHEAYQFKVFYKDLVSPTAKVSLSTAPAVSDHKIIHHHGMCTYKGEQHKVGNSFFDGCHQYCQCTEEVKVHCSPIECPARFGLDLMDPGCLEWEDDTSFVPTPPRCCGQMPKCGLHIDHLACHHMGQKFQHLDFIPKELVGCDQRCQCLSGHLDCESLCSPVTANPPFHLPCDPNEARLITTPTFPCCKEWQCSNDSVAELHPGIHHPGSTIHLVHPPLPPHPDLELIDVKDITETSARILFKMNDVFVGLPGGIFLRYTEDAESNPNPLEWKSEVIHEDGTLMDSSLWEYVKRDLVPDTNYTMQLALFTHLKRTESVSSFFVISTKMAVTTPLPRLDLDAELSVSEIRNTSALISWKHFDDYELQYIDGIRVRFWPGNKKFPLEGPMLHREADSMILRDLMPDNNYTVDLFFIPHPGLTSTISNTKNITFKTLPKPKDKYAFTITIEAGETTRDGVQILYSGVAEPEGKYVNVYRVVYTTDGDSQDSQKFKVPKNQKEGFITLTDLKPGVQYEVWLEAYLTNGNKKKSNVITIRTKPGELPTPEKSGIGKSTQLETNAAGSYYSAFVVMIILFILALVVAIGLVILLLRRQSHAKAHISSSKSSSAYDNPSYKTSENPNYGMELNGLKNTTNGASRTEDA